MQVNPTKPRMKLYIVTPTYEISEHGASEFPELESDDESEMSDYDEPTEKSVVVPKRKRTS